MWMMILRLFLFVASVSIASCEQLRFSRPNRHRLQATSYYYSASGAAILGSPNADAAVGNPLKGLLTSPRWTSNPASSIPSSLEFYYIGLNELMFGPNQFNWTVLDNALTTAASRWKHVIPRIYCHYPGQPLAIPQYLLDAGIPIIGESPQYDDPILLTALEQFIAAFGRRYDGHKSVAFVQLGLLGYWGEWHTYPEQNLLSSATKSMVIAWYKAAFKVTPLQLRDPTDGTGMGLHDDSFAYSTLGSTSWFFWPKVQASGQADFWKYHVMGGETRPELQSTIFESGYQAGSTMYKQDFMQCVETTHATYMLHAGAFSNGGYSGTELQNALYAHARMGYNFEVTKVAVASSFFGTVTVDVTLNQTGVAPFYYPLNLTLSCSGIVLTLGGVDDLVARGQSQVLSFSNIPASSACLSQVNLTLVSSHTYPGRPIRFAQGNGTVSLSLPMPPAVSSPIQSPVIAPVAWPASVPVSVTAPVSNPASAPVRAPNPAPFGTAASPTSSNSLIVSQLLLINADSDTPIQPLVNGTVLTLSKLPTRRLNVQAITIPYPTGSVRFAYDTSSNYRMENTIPYALGGDSGGNYNSWTPSIGRHTITAVPFTGKSGTGITGNRMSISFTVV